MRGVVSMEDKSFTRLAGLILLLCLICQIAALRLLRSSDDAAQVPDGKTDAAIEEVAAKNADASAQKASQLLERKYKALRRMESREEFLKFTANEMEIAKLFKYDDSHRHSQYYTAIIGIDVDDPELLEKARKQMSKREEWLQKYMDELEAFVADADLSCLTEDECSMFQKYVNDRRRWAEIAYDDSVDNETKLEACKAWADVFQQILRIAEKIYKAQYGDAFERYSAEYEGIGIRKVFSYTNRWWINRTDASYSDADGKRHHLRVKLFGE